jgi:Fe-S-cluster-containing dehydrogenase component
VAHASDESKDAAQFRAVLMDIPLCIGCRKCEVACAETHGLPVPDSEDKSVFQEIRTTSTSQWTTVNRYSTEKGDQFLKIQCHHCNQPACASACLVRALEKKEDGPVVWHEDRCMGCRYCMISCPFDIPKFEYDEPVPKIQKCIMCWERLDEGKIPACVEVCPVEALKFGTRRALLENAKSKIYANPGKYIPHVYGEDEVGGTGWLHISSVPFEQLGLKTNLGTTPYPEYTKEFMYGDPVLQLLWPMLLLGMNRITERKAEVQQRGNE